MCTRLQANVIMSTGSGSLTAHCCFQLPDSHEGWQEHNMIRWPIILSSAVTIWWSWKLSVRKFLASFNVRSWNCAIFCVLSGVLLKTDAFWDMTLYHWASSLKGSQCLHLQEQGTTVLHNDRNYQTNHLASHTRRSVSWNYVWNRSSKHT